MFDSTIDYNDLIDDHEVYYTENEYRFKKRQLDHLRLADKFYLCDSLQSVTRTIYMRSGSVIICL